MNTLKNVTVNLENLGMGEVIVRMPVSSNKEKVFTVQANSDTPYFTPSSGYVSTLDEIPAIASRTARRHAKALLENKDLVELN